MSSARAMAASFILMLTGVAPVGAGTVAYILSADEPYRPTAAWVTVVDLGQKRQVATIPLNPLASGLGVSPDGTRLYVSSWCEQQGCLGELEVISTATRASVRRVALPGSAGGLVVTPDGRKVYVSTQAGLCAYDTVTEVLNVVADARWGGIALSADGTRVYFGYPVSILSIDTDTVLSSLHPYRSGGIAVAPDGGHVYFVTEGGMSMYVSRYDANGLALTMPERPLWAYYLLSDVVVTPDSLRVWAFSEMGNGFHELDARTGAVRVVWIGDDLRTATFSDDGRTAYLVSAKGRILVMDPDTYVVREAIAADVNGSGRIVLSEAHTLSLGVAGHGRVGTTDGALDCGDSGCSGLFGRGAVPTVTATAAAGWSFAGWKGDAACPGGTLSMSDDRSCTAVFVPVVQAPAAAAPSDFNGDGRSDVFRYRPSTGEWAIGFADQAGGFGERAGSWSPNWDLHTGDFNGDGLADVFVYDATSGAWYTCVNQGAGDFQYHSGSWSAGWKVTVLDLNGDHRSDLLVYNPTTGGWYTCLTLSPGVFHYTGGHWSPGWRMVAADLSGDARDDVFVYDEVTGGWYWCVSDGVGGFAYRGGSWSPAWDVIAPGDYNGDGRDDLLVYRAYSGEWALCSSSGTGFTYTFGAWSRGWRLETGDFDADGRADVLVYNRDSGAWYECLSDHAGGWRYTGGFWAPGWDVRTVDLNGDGRSDVFTCNPDTGSWAQGITIAPGLFLATFGSWEAGWALPER